MPATLLDDPPGIECVFSDGRRKRWLLDGTGDPALAGDLLAGLAGLVHPHGTVDAPGTVHSYLCATKRSVISPAQRAEIGGDISGSDG